MSQSTDLHKEFNKKHLPALDGVRAVAVSLVIFYHFGIPHVPGAHGVMIFFVLSGFLITWLLLKENEQNGTISLAGFYKRRTLRIFPAFYVFWTLLIVYLSVRAKPLSWPHAVSAFTYTSNYYNAIHGDINDGFSHTWSLAIEEQFYLLWPLAFLFLRRHLARAAAVLAGLIGMIWVYRAVLCYMYDVDQGYVYAAFDTRLDALLIGCLVAILIRERWFPSFWRSVTAQTQYPVLTIGLLLVSIFAGNAYVYRYRDVFGFAIEPLIIAVLLVQLVALSSSRLWAWTEWRVLKFLGRISYSLYLYQQVILFPVKTLMSSFPLILQLIVALSATVLVASLSYYIVELPFLRFQRNRSQLPPKLSTPQVVSP